MQFTVREIHTNYVVVDFPDGSWAQVPYQESMNGNREKLIEAISDYAPKPTVSWINEVPLTVGEVVDHVIVEEDDTEEDDTEEAVLNYKEMRALLYPTVGDQLDAMYWANKGINEPQEQIFEDIEEVKRVVPKDITPMTRTALYLYLAE